MKRVMAFVCMAIGLSCMADPALAQLTWQELETMIRQQRDKPPAAAQAPIVLIAPVPSPKSIRLPIPHKPLPPAPGTTAPSAPGSGGGQCNDHRCPQNHAKPSPGKAEG